MSLLGGIAGAVGLDKGLFGSWGDTFQEGLGMKGQGAYGNKIGGTLNNIMGTSDAARQSYEYNQLSADRDMQRSIYLWNMQNAYNHPAAQIARMAEAGIDVNPMTYAVGNGNMSTTASNISAPGTGSVSVGSHGINPINALMSVLSGIQGLKATDAQIKQIGETTKNISEQNRGKRIENDLNEKDLEFYNTFGFNPNHSSDLVKLLGFDALTTRIKEKERERKYEAYKKGLKSNVTPLPRSIYDRLTPGKLGF